MNKYQSARKIEKKQKSKPRFTQLYIYIMEEISKYIHTDIEVHY